MPIYTFHMCSADGFSSCFELRELPYDSATYPVATALLEEHRSAEYVAVWEGERPVLSRHRDGPVIRAIQETRPSPRSA